MLAYRGIRTIAIFVGVALLVVTAGCGGGTSEPKFKVTEVKGNVTKGGQPLPDAQVSLMPQGQIAPNFPGAGGKTDAQGNFEVMTGSQKGVPAGTYTVVVVVCALIAMIVLGAVSALFIDRGAVGFGTTTVGAPALPGAAAADLKGMVQGLDLARLEATQRTAKR